MCLQPSTLGLDDAKLLGVLGGSHGTAAHQLARAPSPRRLHAAQVVADSDVCVKRAHGQREREVGIDGGTAESVLELAKGSPQLALEPDQGRVDRLPRMLIVNALAKSDELAG